MQEYGFFLSRHPLEARVAPLPKAFVTVSGAAQVRHLQKYLALKLKAGPWERFVLSVQKPGEPTTTPLPAETTLQAVVDAHAVEANSLELFFRFRIMGYD